MWRIRRLIAAALAVAFTQSAGPVAAWASSLEAPALIEEIAGSGVSRLTLTGDAVIRLGIETIATEEREVALTRWVGGEVVAPLGISNSAAANGGATQPQGMWVRLAATGFQPPADRTIPAEVSLLTGENRAIVWTAVPLPAGLHRPEKLASYYQLTDVDHGLMAGQRVLVRVTLAGGGGMKKVIPYSSVIYDEHGGEWVYTSSEPRVFVRQPIRVDLIDGDIAILSEGPSAGTPVVFVGAAELYGTEFEVGH